MDSNTQALNQHLKLLDKIDKAYEYCKSCAHYAKSISGIEVCTDRLDTIENTIDIYNLIEDKCFNYKDKERSK